MRMRKWLLATAALLALVGPAISADLRTPVHKAPPPLVPVWSWSGCFVGGHAARLRAKSESWIVRTPGGDFFGQPLGGHSFDSWLGGVQAGCDYQFAGGFVIGLEGDYAWSDALGSHDSTRETGVAYHSKVVLGHRPCRLCLGSLPWLCQGRRCLGARRVLGDHHHPRHRLYGGRDAAGLDHRCRRR